MESLYQQHREDESVKCLGLPTVIDDARKARTDLNDKFSKIKSLSKTDSNLQHYQDALATSKSNYSKSVALLLDYLQALRAVETTQADEVSKGKRALRFQKNKHVHEDWM